MRLQCVLIKRKSKRFLILITPPAFGWRSACRTVQPATQTIVLQSIRRLHAVVCELRSPLQSPFGSNLCWQSASTEVFSPLKSSCIQLYTVLCIRTANYPQSCRANLSLSVCRTRYYRVGSLRAARGLK